MHLLQLTVLITLGSAVYALPPRVPSHPSQKIVDGVKANEGDVPYIAAVRSYLAPICGAAILSDTWLLSLASCCSTLALNEPSIYYGSVLLSGNGTNATASQVFPHPEYVGFTNDICLIKLKDKIQFSANVQPVKLPEAGLGLPAGAAVTTAGWGNEFLSSQYEGSDQLFILPKLVVIERDLCTAVGPNDYIGNACAFPTNNTGTCVGDYGDPVTNNGTLYGLINIMQRLCGMGYPAFYINVPYYITWIQSIMTNN